MIKSVVNVLISGKLDVLLVSRNLMIRLLLVTVAIALSMIQLRILVWIVMPLVMSVPTLLSTHVPRVDLVMDTHFSLV